MVVSHLQGFQNLEGVFCKAIPGAFTQTATIPELKENMRDVIELLQEVRLKKATSVSSTLVGFFSTKQQYIFSKIYFPLLSKKAYISNNC